MGFTNFFVDELLSTPQNAEDVVTERLLDRQLIHQGKAGPASNVQSKMFHQPS
jgi:hypothetical protein